MVTTTPTTVRATPVSKIVTVENWMVPYNGKGNDNNVCFKKASPNTIAPKPVKTTIAAPVAPTNLKSTGKPCLTVSISKASNNKTRLDASTNPPTNPPPGA